MIFSVTLLVYSRLVRNVTALPKVNFSALRGVSINQESLSSFFSISRKINVFFVLQTQALVYRTAAKAITKFGTLLVDRL